MFVIFSGPQLGTIRKAVVDAYIGAGPQALADLDRTITDFIEGKTIFNYVSIGAPFRDQVGQLLTRANGEGWIASLLGAVQQDRPDREDLQQLLRSLLGTAAAEQVLAVATRPDILAPSVRAELQQLIPGGALVMPDTLERRMRAVCRVDYADLNPPAVGTGFLISPDLVLSNWHVLCRAIDNAANARQLRFRFDLRTHVQAAEGVGRVAFATTSGAAVLKSRPSGGVELPGGSGEPSMQQLDYALVRLSERVGDDLVTGGERRGSITVRRSMPKPVRDSNLMVLQHPMRGPLQFAMGTAKEPNDTGSRVLHTASTQPGSSGSPVLGPGLDLVALHNAARPDTARARQPFNTAVPIAHIVDDLVAAGISDMLQE